MTYCPYCAADVEFESACWNCGRAFGHAPEQSPKERPKKQFNQGVPVEHTLSPSTELRAGARPWQSIFLRTLAGCAILFFLGVGLTLLAIVGGGGGSRGIVELWFGAAVCCGLWALAPLLRYVAPHQDSKSEPPREP